jgi:endonuclease/exonuclease/phosphatase family metal-dependent hydrolase
VEVIANGRGDWIGWVDLKIEEVNEVATRATAHVFKDVDADVIAVVEVESRPTLVRFSEGLLPSAGAQSYDHTMLIDGNDDRGIDVGIMTRKGYELASIESHVDDADALGLIFSRDCAGYTVSTPKGSSITLLVNHLKSKGFGSQAANDAKRLRQATRVKAIYEALIASGQKFVAVVGDFNDTPDSGPLAPLIKTTDLRDISTHANFDDGGRPGTFANGTASEKIDYILLSPNLFAATKGGGVFRKGVWGGKNGTLFPHYDEITKAEEAASDHAAIWAEIDA